MATELLNIKSLSWTQDNNYVTVIGDVAQDGSIQKDAISCTPYNETSIFWNKIKDYPIDDILPYQPTEQIVGEEPLEEELLSSFKNFLNDNPSFKDYLLKSQSE
jgi:hypothetical protein